MCRIPVFSLVLGSEHRTDLIIFIIKFYYQIFIITDLIIFIIHNMEYGECAGEGRDVGSWAEKLK